MSDFPTTLWHTIRTAAKGEPRAQTTVVERCRDVVLRFARKRGVDAAEAEDVAQEVFLALLDERVLARADAAKGHFRSLVFAITTHVIGSHFERRGAKKRGGDRASVSLDDPAVLRSLEDAMAKEVRERDFDREWLAALLARGLQRLGAENEAYRACLEASLAGGETYRAIAARTGKTEASVRNAIARGRARLAAIIREEIASYCSSRGELDSEVIYLESLIGPDDTTEG